MLQDWVFHYNEYRERWEATKRDSYNELWNGDEGNIIRSKNVDTLISLIIRGEGDIAKINKLVK